MKYIARLFVFAACLCASAPLHAEPDIESLIEDLRDDDVSENAQNARRALMRLDTPATEELHDALDSDDWQQRQLACDLLWRMFDPNARRNRHGWQARSRRWMYRSQGALTERMIEVTIEGLRHDGTPYGIADEGNLMLMNAANGLHRLAEHATLAREQLLEGLASDDTQQRFLCALALARGGVTSAADDVLPILLPHLKDNDIPEDAKWCAHAIYRLGEAALPELQRVRDETDDTQQRDTLELLILNIEGPPESVEDAEGRQQLNVIATSTVDPTLNGSADVMWWLKYLQ